MQYYQKGRKYYEYHKNDQQKELLISARQVAYIVIHETDNWSKGADAKAHATAMKNGNLAGTVHYYVDSKSVYQTLDHSDGAWAVGDGKENTVLQTEILSTSRSA